MVGVGSREGGEREEEYCLQQLPVKSWICNVVFHVIFQFIFLATAWFSSLFLHYQFSSLFSISRDFDTGCQRSPNPGGRQLSLMEDISFAYGCNYVQSKSQKSEQRCCLC